MPIGPERCYIMLHNVPRCYGMLRDVTSCYADIALYIWCARARDSGPAPALPFRAVLLGGPIAIPGGMLMAGMKVVSMPIGDVVPYDRNPRFNDAAVEAVANSIREFGWRQPIVVDADGVIIVGHTRFKAAQSLGLTEVPVLVAADLTPEQVQAYRLADNRTGELAEWDMDLLAGELDGLADLDMSAFGFTDDISSMEFMDFDGEGDGGGSVIRNGTRFRVMVGPQMFEIPDPDHSLYAACA